MELLTAAQVADALGVSKARVYDLIRQRLLPACHLGRQLRVEEAALREWVAGGGQALPGGWRKGGEGIED